MAENRILTATELRAQQEAREKAEREAKATKEQESLRKREENREAQIKVAVDQLGSSWHKFVESAAQHTGVRFVVIAEVVSPAERHPLVAQLIEEISGKGYICQIGRVEDAPQRGAVRKDADKEVRMGDKMGLQSPNVPRIGQEGTLQRLVVEW
jgi:hypothetical protein